MFLAKSYPVDEVTVTSANVIHDCGLWFVDLNPYMTWQCFLFADPLEEIAETSPQTAANSAAELLKQGAGLFNFCPCIWLLPKFVSYRLSEVEA